MDPFHEGERAVQERAGERSAALLNARILGSAIPTGALPFIAAQPWVILGGADGEGRLWASALVAEAGFAHGSVDGTRLDLMTGKDARPLDDPLLGHLHPGQRLGALFIELATRRRLRVNGHLTEVDEKHLALAVEEAFPNCPKYIQRRSVEAGGGEAAPAMRARHGETLEADLSDRLASADTLFLATHHPERGVDASHRGGRPGFVEVRDGRTLLLPDYAGNGMFQSFGNLAVDPRMGMLVPEFATGAHLHLSGTARLLWDRPDPADRSGGTGRFLEFTVDRWVLTPPAPGAPRWTFVEASPFNP